VLNFLWENWEENWECKKAKDLNHLVAYNETHEGVHYTTLGELPFPKELIQATMKKFKITEEFEIGQNLQRLRSILRGSNISLKVREEDLEIAQKLFPKMNLHSRTKKKMTVARTTLELLKYLKENDLREDTVDLNRIVLSRRVDKGRRYTQLNELPFPKELIESAMEKFGMDETFKVGEYLGYIRGALKGETKETKLRKDDIEFAKIVFGVSKDETETGDTNNTAPIKSPNIQGNYRSKYWKHVNNDPKELDRIVQKMFFGREDVKVEKIFPELEMLIRRGANRDKFDRQIRIVYYIMREEILIGMANKELNSKQVLEKLQRKFGFDGIILRRIFMAMKGVSQAVQEEQAKQKAETARPEVTAPKELDEK